jgi:hypothetical protein
MTDKLYPLLLFFALVAMVASPRGVPAQSPASTSVRDIPAAELTRQLRDLDARIFEGGLVIAAGDTVPGPIVILRGALEMGNAARVEGDVWVVGGSVVMSGAARVSGVVTLINSEIYATERARVGGLQRLSCDCQLDGVAYRSQGLLVFVQRQERSDEVVSDPSRWGYVIAPARPTRVRFDVLQLGMKYGNDQRPDPHFRLRFTADIPVFPDTPHGFLEGSAGAIIPLSGEDVTLRLDGYKTLHTEDTWQVNRLENSLLLVTTSNEFANYFEKRGGEARVTWSPSRGLGFTLSGLFQQDVSMPKGDVITIFGDEDHLPENPEINDGVRGALGLEVVYDTRIDRFYPYNAWRLGFDLEFGRLDPDSAGLDDIDYTALTMVANRYTRLPLDIQWDIGARVFTAFDPVPYQRYQTLNGYGGVRGANNEPFDIMRGNRLAWLSTELRRELPPLPGFDWVYARWDFLVFGDIGLLAEVPADAGAFDFIGELSGWVKTVGFGISGESFPPYLGIYLAKEIDGDRENPRVIVRLARSF